MEKNVKRCRAVLQSRFRKSRQSSNDCLIDRSLCLNCLTVHRLIDCLIDRSLCLNCLIIHRPIDCLIDWIGFCGILSKYSNNVLVFALFAECPECRSSGPANFATSTAKWRRRSSATMTSASPRRPGTQCSARWIPNSWPLSPRQLVAVHSSCSSSPR